MRNKAAALIVAYFTFETIRMLLRRLYTFMCVFFRLPSHHMNYVSYFMAVASCTCVYNLWTTASCFAMEHLTTSLTDINPRIAPLSLGLSLARTNKCLTFESIIFFIQRSIGLFRVTLIRLALPEVKISHTLVSFEVRPSYDV